MTTIHAVKPLLRLAGTALSERLRVMPAVVLTGARQTGKSTLAERLVPGERRYRSLDDLDVLDAARRDPEALVGGREPVTLDEVQRAPDLLSAVKLATDRDRRAGRFLVTGSANLLLMRQVSESLAYNGLVQSFPEIARLAREGGKPRAGQAALFGEKGEPE